MNGTVPVSSIVCMAASCVVAFAIPVGLFLYFRKKKADILPFFAGCAIMLVFALLLESAVHRIVLSGPAGTVILGNMWLYALYGGMMAGIFEETGRFFAFSTFLKKYRGKDVNALMYGAGHGGFEAAALLGFSMINDIVYSVMINSGNTAALTGSVSGEALTQVQNAMQALITTPSWQFLMGGAERIFAVVLQIALSVLVWFAVKRKDRRYLYPLAILIHFFADALTVILSRLGMPLGAVEAVVGLIAVLAALYAKRVWILNTERKEG